MHGGLLSLSASPQDRLLNFVDPWHHLNLFDLHQIFATRDENERAHFEKIDDNRPKNIITISDNRLQIHPRRGITLQA